MTTLRSKALAIYRTGRLHILDVVFTGTLKECVLAKVQSSRTGGPTYAVDLRHRGLALHLPRRLREYRLRVADLAFLAWHCLGTIALFRLWHP